MVPRRLRRDRVLGGEGDAAHGDDRQDAELKVLQSQDVVAALPKPADAHRGSEMQPGFHSQTQSVVFTQILTGWWWIR